MDRGAWQAIVQGIARVGLNSMNNKLISAETEHVSVAGISFLRAIRKRLYCPTYNM